MCSELNVLGLNLNASKVQQFDKDGIRIFYATEIFALLDNNRYDDALDKFYAYKKLNSAFKESSVLRKIINVKIEKFNLCNQNKIKSLILEYDYLKQEEKLYFDRIYNQLHDLEKDKYITLLLKIAAETTYNSFHYNLLNFLENHKEKYSDKVNIVKQRIEDISSLNVC